MADIHRIYPAPAPVPAPGFSAGDRVRCTRTARTGTVFIVARTGIVTVDLDGDAAAPGGSSAGVRVIRTPESLERIEAGGDDPAVLVRLPASRPGLYTRVLRRDGGAHWIREEPA